MHAIRAGSNNGMVVHRLMCYDGQRLWSAAEHWRNLNRDWHWSAKSIADSGGHMSGTHYVSDNRSLRPNRHPISR